MPFSEAAMHQVVIVLGSESDLTTTRASGMLEVLRECQVSFELSVISAHRNAAVLATYCAQKQAEGTQVFVGIAGMAAALPGAIAASIGFGLPVIGVALPSSDFPNGLDALLAIVRMPPGAPVICSGVGKAGCKNAALIAGQIVGASDPRVKEALADWFRKNNRPPSLGIET